ncbi:hypothetical protein PHLGIDRAFT_238674 [Phlebiopsis gigantea 11061_1 CR5-6]|uniref:Uncharacterized protein n=1 Tax=Phlebiopsis gigantea (strain 11061_1 CR5-6) TaxID=745531 RepID=A0A0C3RSN1_PHLG1|nr:hypothetical protein PHLGIDRAFT_238674 [Phlebiopsis gigantea 11061_1 CR5-6]
MWPVVEVCTVAATVAGTLGSELEGTQPLFLGAGLEGSRLGVGGRRRSRSDLTALFAPKILPLMPCFGCDGVGELGEAGRRRDTWGVKGLGVPGTAKTKLKGNGIEADDAGDGGEQLAEQWWAAARTTVYTRESRGVTVTFNHVPPPVSRRAHNTHALDFVQYCPMSTSSNINLLPYMYCFR